MRDLKIFTGGLVMGCLCQYRGSVVKRHGGSKEIVGRLND
jgi:hypothetical protein